MQPGRRFAQRYRLERPGRADLWIAHDEVLARRVLVAFATPDRGDALARFRADALALARVSHPHIVATYDTGVEPDGTAFRVDELIEAEPLSGLRNAGTLTPARVVSAIGQVAKALEHAHSHGLAHGALAGDDVLVCDDDRVKLCGLGVAGPGRDPARDFPALVGLFAELGPAAGGASADLAARWAEDPPATMAELRRALLELDTGPDDATPMSSRTPTPPHGTTIRRRRGWVPLAALTLLAGAGLAVAGTLIGGTGPSGGGAASGQPVTVTASSFDPEARPPTENETRAGLAVDGDPATAWTTERYRSRPFAGLKKGVGLILRVGEPTAFSRLTVQSPTQDWAAEIYVTEEAPAALAGWGTAVARRAGVMGSATFDIGQVRGRAVLIWITDTGPARRVSIQEARLEGRP